MTDEQHDVFDGEQPTTPETKLERVVRMLSEMAEHVRNAQIDIDWLKEHVALMRAGVQGVVDEQAERDRNQVTLLTQQATMNERMSWVVVFAVVPGIFVMGVGGLSMWLLTAKLVRVVFDIVQRSNALALW